MKLEERDKRVLALLGTRARSLSKLAVELDVPPEELGEQLTALADNGLVYDLGDGRYERTESGRRVLVSSVGGATDERFDTTPEVERALDELALRPDEADAVRHAFSFVRYWGRVSQEELIDAIYSEAAAGRETPEDWWNGLVRGALSALPGVEPAPGNHGFWRYTGPAEADAPFTDGRRVLSKTHPVYGDVKHALESLDLTGPEREAARAAFGYLYRRGNATERELRDTVYPAHPAGYDSARAWLDAVIRDTFEALPGVEQTGEGAWRYRRN